MMGESLSAPQNTSVDVEPDALAEAIKSDFNYHLNELEANPSRHAIEAVLLRGVAWYGVVCSNDRKTAEIFSPGWVEFTAKQIDDLAEGSTKYKPLSDWLTKMSTTSADKRSLNRHIMGNVTPAGCYSDREFARAILAGNISLTF